MNAATILHIHRISIFALCKCANCDVRQPTNPRIFSEDIRNGRVFVFAYKIQCFPYPENIVAYCVENYYFAIQESLTSRRRRRKEKKNIFCCMCRLCVDNVDVVFCKRPSILCIGAGIDHITTTSADAQWSRLFCCSLSNKFRKVAAKYIIISNLRYENRKKN